MNENSAIQMKKMCTTQIREKQVIQYKYDTPHPSLTSLISI